MPLYKRPLTVSPPSRWRHNRGGGGGGSKGAGGRRYAHCFNRASFTMRCLLTASLFSLVSVLYWISYTSYIDPLPSWISSLGEGEGDDIRHHVMAKEPPSLVEPTDIIDEVDLARFSQSQYTLIMIFCGPQPAFDFYNYLSLSSAVRAYDPTRTVILYEIDPPEIRSNWTQWIGDGVIVRSGSTDNDLVQLLSSCDSFEGFTRMKNGSKICGTSSSPNSSSSSPSSHSSSSPSPSSSAAMREFIMKLLLRYGGLYVGRRTFLTQVTSYLRHGVDAIVEHVLQYLDDDGEGFVWVKGRLDAPVANSSDDMHAHFGGGDESLPSSEAEKKRKVVPMKIITSREVRCFESESYATDILHRADGNAVYSCVIMTPSPEISPMGLMTLRSDFGSFARKAVFNIHNDWETRFYVKLTNTSLVPPLCWIKDTGDLSANAG